MAACTTRHAHRERHRTEAGSGREPAPDSVAPQRARHELMLTPREFELALELGEFTTVPPQRSGGRRRVAASELARLRAEPGFPDVLRVRLRVVGAGEGAALLGVGPARFTRLARAGCFGPVRYTVNRYRRLVWLYLAAELEQFAAWHPGLLHGALPRTLRAPLAEREDWRPRLWRGRRVAQLLRHAEGPWGVAAVHAAVLAPRELVEAVPASRERLALAALRPSLSPVRTDSPAAAAAVAEVLTARAAEEVHWHRLSLALALAQARREAPGGAAGHPLGPPRPPAGEARPSAPPQPGAAGEPGRGSGPGNARGAVSARGSGVDRAEQALLHDGDEQLAVPVVDPPARQPAPTGRDG
ncbi:MULTISPECIES: DUF6397 family protein [Streptomyces]|uniref:DUF6397 family protein n=1 Tax=Streptomyces TaxID=1883 RepID=UPI002249136E|nr:DUF6397 family protein [Streptomyces sp. JHD 1]MCX2968443.1 DUF6397 family protein [Streptomyces sp. JHD 1]